MLRKDRILSVRLQTDPPQDGVVGETYYGQT
jgi:hypothetical protein